jgi:hypothetical protein
MTLTPPHRKDQRNRQRRRRGDGDALVTRVRSIATLSAFPCSYHAASTTRPIDGIFYISAQKRALPASKTVTTQAAVKSGPTTRWSFHTCYPNEYYYSFCSHTTRSLPSLPIISTQRQPLSSWSSLESTSSDATSAPTCLHPPGSDGQPVARHICLLLLHPNRVGRGQQQAAAGIKCHNRSVWWGKLRRFWSSS